MHTILTHEQMTRYQREGYLYAPGVIPDAVLNLARTIFQRWVDQTIAGWVEQGLLQETYADLGMDRRLVVAWNAAGKPHYNRSPRRDLVSREMYDFLTHPTLLTLATELLGTPEVSVHGVFNARPKLPDQRWTDTPWHQDAQYYRDAEHIHVVSLWIPLQRVTEQNSCLQVAPGHQQDTLYENYLDETGFIGLSPADRRHLNGLSITMDPGDLLCFTQIMPHRALSNLSETVRWSMDIRYESTLNATPSGKKQGFIAHSLTPEAVLSYEDWLKKWDSIPAGGY